MTIVLTSRLPKDVGAVLMKSFNVVLMQPEGLKDFRSVDKQKTNEYFYAYYLVHELLHIRYPDEDEASVHGRTVCLLAKRQKVNDYHLSLMRALVQDAKDGQKDFVKTSGRRRFCDSIDRTKVEDQKVPRFRSFIKCHGSTFCRVLLSAGRDSV